MLARFGTTRAEDANRGTAPGIDDEEDTVVPRRPDQSPTSLPLDRVRRTRDAVLIIDDRLDSFDLEAFLNLPPVAVVAVESLIVTLAYTVMPSRGDRIPLDLGGYYRPDPAKADAVMRPSKTLNEALSLLRPL